ncbi:hypothetical protein PoB_002328900 [Plakobranchus ocellatus]|uniref:Uncharacterized protein n=1 Tax=Plakobranchus ocellatus TaxID=259542 RepID=A0AAV3ZQV7_9GAST|nr:hypothetical protein PoB_002328900 [Plakobranchus ocellatus]
MALRTMTWVSVPQIILMVTAANIIQSEVRLIPGMIATGGSLARTFVSGGLWIGLLQGVGVMRAHRTISIKTLLRVNASSSPPSAWYMQGTLIWVAFRLRFERFAREQVFCDKDPPRIIFIGSCSVKLPSITPFWCNRTGS